MLVGIDGLESNPSRSHERRWRVKLKALDDTVSIHSVSSQYLWLLQLGSKWLHKKCVSTELKVSKEEFFLDDSSPRFIWRENRVHSEGVPVFLEDPRFEMGYTSSLPSYQLIDSLLDDQLVTLCISSGEFLRFFVGRSPAFSRHIFDFTEKLTNRHLFRVKGHNFDAGVPDVIEFLDRNLGEKGKKLLIATLTDNIGKKQVLLAARSARAAYVRNRLSNGTQNKIHPLFGLPYVAGSSLEVLGRNRTISIELDGHSQLINVFAVSRILDTGHHPAERQIEEVYGVGAYDDGRPSRPGPRRESSSDTNNPHDVLRPSDSDIELLTSMGVNETDSYSGLDRVEIKETVEPRDSPIWPVFEKETDSISEVTGSSTELGGDLGGTIAHSKGVDDTYKPVIQKSLLLVDEDLPDLLSCLPEVVAGMSDVIHVERRDSPEEFALLTACLDLASEALGTGWRVQFLGEKNHLRTLPLISLSRFKDVEIVKKTGKPRRALIGIMENEEYRIIFADIERVKNEPIGIFSLLTPINANLGWSEVSYIIQCRLPPPFGLGTWPNSKTHGGGYIAKVQAHRMFWTSDDFVALKLEKFIGKLYDQAEFLEDLKVG